MLVAEPVRLDQIFSKLGGLRHVALAVSGGSDSMAMLRMVHEWTSALKQPPKLIVLTVDHGLRDAAADEAKQVAQWCAVLEIPHHILKWQHDGVKSGIQAKARAARYDLMSEWCAAHDVWVLLTAHTVDDQAETVAMRQARTDSLHSIAGIWPEREWKGIQVQRPLLKMRRLDLQSYLREIGQDWIDDPSNEDPKFERVRVRQELAGDLRELDAQADAAQEFIERSTHASKLWCSSNIKIHETGFLTLHRAALSKLYQTEFDLVVLRMIDLCGYSKRKVEREERFKLQTWMLEEKTGRRTLGGALFAKRKDLLIVAREPGRISKVPLLIGTDGALLWDGRFHFKGPVGASILPLRDLGPVARRDDIPAFVQAGLPAIVQNGQIWSIPHLGIGQPVEIKFLRH